MKVLILGDGNFSFSLALAKLLHQQHTTAIQYVNSTTAQLICTSFDSYEELIQKYHDCKKILEELKEYATIEHGVNAWELEYKNMDLIVWNHPHLGTEDFRLHQFLMAHFFDSAKQALSPGGRIRISLVQGQETRWNVFVQANRVGLELLDVELFDELKWPGYVVKRNTRGGSFKNTHTKKHVKTPMKSCVYTFGTADTFIPIEEVPQLLESFFGKKYRDTHETKEFQVFESDLTPPSQKKDIPKELKCPHCQKEFCSPRGYRQHVHMVHVLKKFGDWAPDRPKTIPCSFCDKLFAANESLEQHITNKHTDNDIMDTINSLCINDNTSTDNKEDINSSIDNGLSGEYEYIPCPVCGQSCVNEDWGMELHLERLKPALGLNMKCPLCPNTFIEQRGLIQHYKFCKRKPLSS